MSTFMAKKPFSTSSYVIDAADQVIGWPAVAIAKLQRAGKPEHTPYIDTAISSSSSTPRRNSPAKVGVTDLSRYTRHPGGLKVVNAKEMLAKKPR